MTSKIFAHLRSPQIRVDCPHFPKGSMFVQNIFPRSAAYIMSCQECGLILQSQWVTQPPGRSCLVQELVNLGELSRPPRPKRYRGSKYYRPTIHQPSAGNGPSDQSPSSTSKKPDESQSIPRFADPKD